MLPGSGDNLAVPHKSDPSSDDILAAVGGHLNVHSSSVPLEVGRHLGVVVTVSDTTDLSFSGMHGSIELVDSASGLAKVLVGDGGASLDGQDEAICDGPRCVGEVVVFHVEEGLS